MIGLTLEQVLDQAITSRLEGVWSALPGRVLAFDPTGPSVAVQPFPSIYQNGEAVDLPILHSVPVAYPSGGGASLTYPLQAGDVVLLVFSTLPLARYRDEDAEGDPTEARRFDLSDAWALPLAAGNAPSATAGRTILTQPDSGKVQIGDALSTPAAARLNDEVTIPMNTVTVGQLVAAMAQIASSGSCVPFNLKGYISTGSSTVEVA